VKVRKAEIDPQRGGIMAKKFAAPFMLILWLTCNLSFLWALTMVRISTVTAIFSTNTAFVFVLSYIVLKEKSNEWKLLAVCCAVVGVCLATVGAENSSGDDGDDGSFNKTEAFMGCLLSVLSALLAALYKVQLLMFPFFFFSFLLFFFSSASRILCQLTKITIHHFI
jgi:solute carrier family 35, member F3/4